MTDVLIVLLAVAAGATTAAMVTGWRPRRSPTWLEDATRARIMVNTTDGHTIEGSLVRADAGGIVLSPARYTDAQQDLAGNVWIPRERVGWIQQPGRS